MKHAINELKLKLDIFRNNEPIIREEGNLEQADSLKEKILDIEGAIGILEDPRREMYGFGLAVDPDDKPNDESFYDKIAQLPDEIIKSLLESNYERVISIPDIEFYKSAISKEDIENLKTEIQSNQFYNLKSNPEIYS